MWPFQNKVKVNEDLPGLAPEKILRLLSVVGDLNTELNLDTILQEAADRVRDLGYNAAAVFLLDGDELRSLKVSSAPLINLAMQLMPKELNTLSVSLKSDTENLIVKSILENKMIKGEDEADFIYPAVPKSIAKQMQRILGIKELLAFPLLNKTIPIGAMMISSVEFGQIDRDLPLLESFAATVSVTINNASLYSSSQSQLIQISQKNSDLQSLYNLSSKVSESLEPSKVAQTAVNSLPQDKFIIGSIISTHDEETNTIGPIAVTQNELAHQAQKIVGDFTKLRLDLKDENAQSNLAVRAFIEEKKIYTNEIGKYMEPVVFSNVISKVLQLINIKSIAIHPITWKNETHGVITYFIKDKAAEEVTDSEKQLLDTYTSHITIALENAELYKMQKQIQEELETAYEQVQSLRQHEQDMIDIMGHELRTPITIVRNSLGVMEMEFKKNGTIPQDKLARYIDIAMESARREVRLVETLLSSAKADSRGFQLMFEKVDVMDVVQDSLELFKKEGAKKGLEVVFNTTGEFLAYADRVRTQEIVDNLLSNAVKYTDKGKIEVALSKDADNIIIEVSDSGIGMTAEDIKRLGKKFYRVDQYISKDNEIPTETKQVIRPGGTGLGLYVTFSLTRIMDGSYKVESEVGKGSKFIINLPIYRDQPNKQEQRKVEDDEVEGI